MSGSNLSAHNQQQHFADRTAIETFRSALGRILRAPLPAAARRCGLAASAASAGGVVSPPARLRGARARERPRVRINSNLLTESAVVLHRYVLIERRTRLVDIDLIPQLNKL